MARAIDNDLVRQSLLQAWTPPNDAGEAIGVLATTFTFDAAFFEEECLGRFAAVEADAQRDGALYRIEREERLAQLRCATVLADIHHAGGSRSLRWDLLAARPRSGVMHAKVSLLAWERHVRIIIGSSNLTGEAYRRNRECAGVLDFGEVAMDRALVDPVLAFLRELLDLAVGPGRERALSLIDWVTARPWRAPPPARGLQRRVVLVGPGRPGVFEQLAEALPGRADEAHVVSPFFDKGGGRLYAPDRRIWEELMRRRGEASVGFHVAGEPRGDAQGWRLALPSHIVENHALQRASASLRLHAIEVLEDRERRPLHAKSLALVAVDWSALLIGSSNFTCAGLGPKGARVVNWEANLLYWVKADARDPLRRGLAARFTGGNEVSLADDNQFDPVFGDEAQECDEPVLPAFFESVSLERLEANEIDLHFRFSDGKPPANWVVRDRDLIVASHVDWWAAGRPRQQLRTCRRLPPTASTLRVEWRAGEIAMSADWPINVESADVLPVPDELRDLSLAALLDLLGSGRPLREALRNWLRRQPDDDDADPESALELVDPHAKVDTSEFLVQRVRRACWAMRHLRGRLEEPLASESAWTWRLEGPVGARVLMAAMLRGGAAPMSADEAAFMLAEFERELALVRLEVRGDDALRAFALERLALFRAGLDERLQALLPACTESMRRYVQQPSSYLHDSIA